MPSFGPPATHGLSGALCTMRTSDQVAPLSADVIIFTFPVLPALMYC